MRGRAVAAALLISAIFGCAPLPPEPPVRQQVTLDQNWSDAERAWFYHVSQGTKLLPYAWFLALEQPVIPSFGKTEFAAPEFLARFGFLPDKAGPDNPDGLPVGFARDDRFNADGEPVVGLTCAACHTAQIDYRGRGIRIDGGPAMTNTGGFQEQLGITLALTYYLDWRFDRFARKALGPDDTPEARARLRVRLEAALNAAQSERQFATEQKLYPVTEGPGRLDAIGRGANHVFGTVLQDRRNYAVADAPVSYPPLWGAPWFDWVQYSGVARQPMSRNIAEAAGVRSLVKLSGPAENLYTSTVRIENLDAIERLLAGPTPAAGLRPPPWPEHVLDPIDRAAAERGRAQFATLCAGCHEAPWTPPDRFGRSYRRLVMKSVQDIGTDPKAAVSFATRTAYLTKSAATPVSAAEGLKLVTGNIARRWYDDHKVPEAKRVEMDGYRSNDWRAPTAYRAPPLNGVWATAPYLHNGSVPNLYQMLLPADRRDAVFHVGSREFDPKRVGFETGAAEGSFRFDTAIPGNWNRGHEFRNALIGNGVIGPELTDAQRWDIIEYLKTY